jgi:hypothetical protein
MPPGGFRLAIVNCHDIEAGRQARDALRSAFIAQGDAPTEPLQQEMTHA